MKPKCEICHHTEATTTVWLDADQSPIKVAGRYRACDKCAEGKK